ncbi:selenocysteine-specific translation elongation factor [Salinicola peritrichatus]|uniref:selenocysteine-specific translation elongation factor n=1 Tax=Salinicola peritrichatus TaxID=1267424 RepID=UPI000DA1FC01|nr:selenocysteine-specific translation elongation factor [Salinicola peritrichatus]
MIVGTAGHVDHGKTALIQALTGVATDRLKEEQARGLTIEAGYAYPDPPADFPDATLGFIDVPGHERFIANMLSGAAGIEAMLLVVAADDGIMPQTREHTRILELLGVTRAWVALTKIDRVEPSRADAVRAEVDAWLGETPFAGAPIFPLSSVSGEGIAPLQRTLWTAAANQPTRADAGGFRLAVDRVFVKSGAGVVVTGTVRGGVVHLGDSVQLLPSLLTARVRGLRTQNRETERAGYGERCAINLSGSDIERGRVTRGDWVVGEHSPIADRQRLDVSLHLLPEAPPLAQWTPVHLHHASAHVTGRVSLLEGESLRPGETMLAQLVLESPLQPAHGDAIVVRDHGASRTLAGARVLDVTPPRRGARRAERLVWLRALQGILPDSAAPTSPDRLWPALGADRGVDLDALAANLDLAPDEVAASAERAGWQVVAGSSVRHAFPDDYLQARYRYVLARLAEIHASEPSMRGAEIDRLRRMSAPSLPPELFRPLLERWKRNGEIVQRGPFVALASHHATLSNEETARWQQVRPLLAASPFEPPRVRDIAHMLAWPEAEVRELLRNCALLGKVYQLRHDHFFLTPAVAQLAAWIRELDALAAEGVTAAAFRDRVGCGRKLAVAILEFFDRIGFTRRVGDSHKVLREDMLFE